MRKLIFQVQAREAFCGEFLVKVSYRIVLMVKFCNFNLESYSKSHMSCSTRKIFMFFMSNPMYIIGSMFFVKKILRKLQELGDDEPEL